MPAAVYIETHGGTGDRRLGRPRRRRHRAHVHRDAARDDAGRVSARTCAPAAPRRAASRAAPPSGRTPRSRWRSRVLGWADGRARLPDPDAVLRMVERVVAEGDARAATSAADLGPDDARALLRAWLDAVGLAAEGPRPDRADAGRRLHPRGSLPPRARLPRAHASRPPSRRRSPRPPTRERLRRGAARLAVRRLRARDPLRAGDGVPRPREGASSRRATASRRRVALVVDAAGSMHGVTHTIEQIRERGVPGFEVEVIGTDAERRPPPAGGRRGRDPLLRGAAGRRPEPPGARRDARRGPLRPRAPRVARAGGRRRGADRARSVGCRASAATTPSSPPTPGCAPATSSSSTGCGSRCRCSTGSARSCSRRARRPTARSLELGIEAEPDRALGPAASTPRRFTPGKRDPALVSGRDPRSLRGPADAREGRRPARRVLPPRARARPAPAPAARRRRPRGGRPARATRRAGDVPRLARGRASWRAPTRAPTCSCSAARPTRSAR